MTGGPSEVRKRAGGASGSKIIKKVWIRASRKVVFSALTESRELIHWFCDRASCDPREGGEIAVYWRSGGQRGRAVITRIEPESALEILWVDDGSGSAANQGASHTLTYEIRSKSGMTELVMTDIDKSEADEEALAVLDNGWNLVLIELKDYCERRERSSKIRSHSKPEPSK